MNTKSYSNVNTIQKQKEYLSRRLDKYAKFYWRGEDMWETYSTFITNNGSALKFVNGPSFSNEYSSPQYDHAMGNLTGVKFTRMQVSFSICTYGVTVEQYRKLIAALGPYEVDYLSFDYDDKLCYLAKTTGMKEGTKTVIGINSEGKDLYMVENNITFEVQGEQCALAQRQYVWMTNQSYPTTDTQNDEIVMLETTINSDDMLSESELPFGIVSEIRFQPKNTTTEGELELYLKDDSDRKISLCDIVFNKITVNWQNTSSNNASSFQLIDNTFLVKYDSSSGLVFLSYGETDYKILNLLLTNTYGEYLIKSMATQKVKIDKNENVADVKLYWRLKNLDYIYNSNQEIDKTTIQSYGRAKTILI